MANAFAEKSSARAEGDCDIVISRFLAPVLQEEFGQTIAVENRPGASGTLAVLAMSRARPDGYTMLMTTISASAVVPPLMNPPPFDQVKPQLQQRASQQMVEQLIKDLRAKAKVN